MPASPAPSDPGAQLQWLVARAEISDPLVEFARALDDRDWLAYAATYADDGVLEVPGAFRFEGRDQMARADEYGLARYAGTWHLSANHAISIDGDRATTRSYLLAAHLLGRGRHDHADGAGWYDCTLRRTTEGWRFTSVRIQEVWTNGTELPSNHPDTSSASVATDGDAIPTVCASTRDTWSPQRPQPRGTGPSTASR